MAMNNLYKNFMEAGSLMSKYVKTALVNFLRHFASLSLFDPIWILCQSETSIVTKRVLVLASVEIINSRLYQLRQLFHRCKIFMIDSGGVLLWFQSVRSFQMYLDSISRLGPSQDGEPLHATCFTLNIYKS